MMDAGVFRVPCSAQSGKTTPRELLLHRLALHLHIIFSTDRLRSDRSIFLFDISETTRVTRERTGGAQDP